MSAWREGKSAKAKDRATSKECQGGGTGAGCRATEKAAQFFFWRSCRVEWEGISGSWLGERQVERGDRTPWRPSIGEGEEGKRRVVAGEPKMDDKL